MTEEKREFIRVPVNVKAYLRELTYPDEVQLFHEGPATALDSLGIDLASANLSEPMLRVLSAINAKIDLLLSIQGQQRLLADFPVHLDAHEISGAGAMVFSAKPLTVGKEVEIVFLLMHTPLRLAGAMGKVVREELFHGRPSFVIDFTRIRERDLEFIVQAVFQAQRDEMHGHKWD
jgi:hypothetical protein